MPTEGNRHGTEMSVKCLSRAVTRPVSARVTDIGPSGDVKTSVC